MRKVFLLSALFLIFATYTATAQVTAGIKGGINSSWLAPIPGNEDRATNIGWGFGGFARVSVPVVGIHVQPELLITQKGGKLESDNGNIIETRRLTNIDIPVMLGKGFAGNILRFQVGPEFSFILDATQEEENKNLGTTREFELTNVNDFLLGWQVGLGADIPGVGLTVDLRYAGTITRFFEDNANFRPNAIWLTVGYKFL